MSAYGYEMERALSAHSLLSRGGSESESRSTMETGVYMSPFAATVFIGGLVTVGVSVLTLLIAMTMMLQTCQSQRDGVVEMQKSTESQEYCRIMALHFELNGLDTSSLPSVCKELAVQNLQDGHYMVELKKALKVAESYFSNIRPGEDGKDVVLMDLDDLIPPRFSNNASSDGKDAIQLTQTAVQQMYMKLRDGGWKLILLSRKHERLRNTMVEYLISVGCGGWLSMITSVDDEMQMDSQEYISRRKIRIQKEGLCIIGAISSQLDFLIGPRHGGLMNFKLPNANTMF